MPQGRMRGFDDSNGRKQSLLGDESRKQSLLAAAPEAQILTYLGNMKPYTTLCNPMKR